jgi:hypothetical protein
MQITGVRQALYPGCTSSYVSGTLDKILPLRKLSCRRTLWVGLRVCQGGCLLCMGGLLDKLCLTVYL